LIGMFRKALEYFPCRRVYAAIWHVRLSFWRSRNPQLRIAGLYR
jgi:hypothetical protein